MVVNRWVVNRRQWTVGNERLAVGFRRLAVKWEGVNYSYNSCYIFVWLKGNEGDVDEKGILYK